MEIAALIAWILTALGGSLMFSIWLRRGGLREPANSRIRPPSLIYGHAAIGWAGLALWVVYLFDLFPNLAWIDFIILLLQASIGLTMYALTRPSAERSPAVLATENTQEVVPPEHHFPMMVVRGHGAMAVLTTILVLLSAIGVGTVL